MQMNYSNLVKHEQFGSCSQCGQCNQTADAKSVNLYKDDLGRLFCDKCRNARPMMRKHNGYGSCNSCGQCNMSAKPESDVTLYTDGHGGIYCTKCLKS